MAVAAGQSRDTPAPKTNIIGRAFPRTRQKRQTSEMQHPFVRRRMRCGGFEGLRLRDDTGRAAAPSFVSRSPFRERPRGVSMRPQPRNPSDHPPSRGRAIPRHGPRRVWPPPTAQARQVHQRGASPPEQHREGQARGISEGRPAPRSTPPAPFRNAGPPRPVPYLPRQAPADSSSQPGAGLTRNGTSCPLQGSLPGPGSHSRGVEQRLLTASERARQPPPDGFPHRLWTDAHKERRSRHATVCLFRGHARPSA